MSLESQTNCIDPDDFLTQLNEAHHRGPGTLKKWFESGCTVEQVAARLCIDARDLNASFAKHVPNMTLADYAKDLYENSPQREREQRINEERYRGALPHNSRPRSERIVRLGRYGKKHY